jgi:hypothetical protein
LWRVFSFFVFFFGFLCLFVPILFVSLVIAVLFGNLVHNCIGLLHFDKLLVFVEEVCLLFCSSGRRSLGKKVAYKLGLFCRRSTNAGDKKSLISFLS